MPFTGAIHLGTSATTLLSLVPNPPANIIASLIIGIVESSPGIYPALAGGVWGSKIFFFHQFANNMPQHNMAFLYAGGIAGRYIY
jgi:hypothetical protein